MAIFWLEKSVLHINSKVVQLSVKEGGEAKVDLFRFFLG